jgi:hypothetical protein
VKWTVWNNGSRRPSGGGYGFRVPIADRDAFFDRAWRTVVVELPTAGGYEAVEIEIAKGSFWGDCHEIIDRRIGRWLIDRGLSDWPRGTPPAVEVESVGERRFRVRPSAFG